MRPPENDSEWDRLRAIRGCLEIAQEALRTAKVVTPEEDAAVVDAIYEAEQATRKAMQVLETDLQPTAAPRHCDIPLGWRCSLEANHHGSCVRASDTPTGGTEQ